MAILNTAREEPHTSACKVSCNAGPCSAHLVEDAQAKQEQVVARVLEIADRVASQPDLDPRAPDEIIGYDEFGVPA